MLRCVRVCYRHSGLNGTVQEFRMYVRCIRKTRKKNSEYTPNKIKVWHGTGMTRICNKKDSRNGAVNDVGMKNPIERIKSLEKKNHWREGKEKIRQWINGKSTFLK